MAIARDVASQDTFARMAPGAYTNISLGQKQGIIVQGGPGETVVLNLKNFVISGSATFTLQRTATTNFIINVTKQFSLSNNAKIVLSGGLQWNHVFFDVLGKGDVTLSGHSWLAGILTASQRMVKLTDHSTVWGQVIANKVLIRDSAQIIHPLMKIFKKPAMTRQSI